MNITKSGQALTCGQPDEQALEQINRYTRRKMGAEELYTFALVLCDNEIDRDGERFGDETLKQLAGLFQGKTGISDHQWKSGNQVARIYSCRFETPAGKKTSDGRDYACVKAWAYMLRTDSNKQLIAEIEGGIKRETSVGCAVAESVCSICGKEYGSADCGHRKGQTYKGKTCHVILRGAVDAYEWSFVAVPAQRNAGVTKAAAPEKAAGAFGPAGEETQALAQLGLEYLAELRAEVKRLGLICDRQLYKGMDGLIGKMEAGELKALRKTLEARAAEKLPLVTQLPAHGSAADFDSGEYIV